jgi:hypothetical protein
VVDVEPGLPPREGVELGEKAVVVEEVEHAQVEVAEDLRQVAVVQRINL